jgi:hypothetical protein
VPINRKVYVTGYPTELVRDCAKRLEERGCAVMPPGPEDFDRCMVSIVPAGIVWLVIPEKTEIIPEKTEVRVREWMMASFDLGFAVGRNKPLLCSGGWLDEKLEAYASHHWATHAEAIEFMGEEFSPAGIEARRHAR